MNLDELQSVQSRERQASGLQHLRSSFYADVGEFIDDLQAERAQAVEAADDPFASPDVRQLTDDIETARQTVEALYERRVGKVVKMASIAAADMPVEDDGLTAEERDLFDRLVERITENRDDVLSVLDGGAPNVSCSVGGDDASAEGAGEQREDGTPASGEPGAPPRADADAGDRSGVSAADLMGEGSAAGGERPPADREDERPETDAETGSAATADGRADHGRSTDDGGQAVEAGAAAAGGSSAAGGDARESAGRADEPAGESGVRTVERTTVRITRDVGEILGVDERAYHLSAEDVVTLPEANAEPLLQRDAAERIR